MRRDIQFYSETSLLQGHLYLPEGSSPDSKLPCVILCHGFAGVKELLLPKFAQAFAEKGFAALTFDYRGFGASGGEKGRLVWREQVQDIRNAITFAGTLDEVNPEKIALWGTSYGGANIIETASQDHRVKCLVVQISFGNGERVITRGQTPEQKEKLLAMLEKAWQREVAKGRPMMLPIEQILTDAQSKQFFKDNVQEFPCLDSKLSILFIKHTLEYHPEDRLPHLHLPILILGAEKDETNPIAETQSLYAKANEPKRLHIIQGAGHYEVYKGSFFEEAFGVELEWLQKHLV